MHNYKRSPSMLLGRKALGAAVASALMLLAAGANATGLGRLTVLSALGQPLRAEIELTSPSKEDIGSLVPKLASADAFKQANIDFNPALNSLRFVVEQRGSGYVIRVSSSQAMNEPFVDLLLELNSSNGKLLREYTFLLDPAELRNSQSAQVANPVSIANIPSRTATPQSQPSQARPGVAPPPVSAAPATPPASSARRPAAQPQETARDGKSAGDYQVKSGDTLSKIAGTYKSEGVSLDQMLVSLYKANPQAFAGNNMNRLKAGQILTVPDADTVRGAGNAESHSVVMAHAADFSAYRNKLAGQVATAPAEKATSTKQGASGNITAKVKELPTATNEAADKLKLSKANPNAVAAAKAGAGKPGEEDRLAKDKAIADANARVKELEKNVGDLQKVLQVKDKDLAAKQAAAAKPEVKPAPAPAVVPTPTPAPAAAPVVASAPAVAAASAPATTVASAATEASAPAKPAPAKRKAMPPPPPPPEPGFFDSLLDNPLVLPLGGALLVLLGGYGIFTSRRKKKLQQFEDSILTGSSMKANSMFGSTGGQSVDTNNSVFNSNFAPSASQLDANEVDPVAEADVYIAYGRDSQAEEILKEALRTQPDRHAVRVKLLEIYSNRKDTKSYERLASELYGMTGGKGEEWAQAASMGIMLEPGNPLYAGGKAADALSTVAAMGSSTQPLEDLDPEALLANSLSQDMLESISIIDTASAKSNRGIDQHGADDATVHLGAAPTMDIGPLDFDLDIPTASAPEVEAQAPHIDAPRIPEQSTASLAKSDDEHAAQNSLVDFESIDFDLGQEEPVAKAAPVADMQFDLPESKSLDLDATKLDHAPSDGHSLNMEPFDLALPVEHGNEIAFESVAPAATEHLPNIAADIPDLPGLDHQDEAAAAEQAPANYDFDLSGIDLNLDTDEHKPAMAAVEEADGQAYNAEMATKLDLAVAYHEIGDKEGARELLDEVLKGGTSDQIHKAQAMLAQLG